KAEQIFEQVAKFAGYGFNKSHAAAYALVAYQTAYLKANYPVEFLAASMTFDMGNTDKLNVFRQELERLGIALLPPDINRSRADFGVEEIADGEVAEGEGTGAGRAVRYALGAIKNVGEAAMAALVAEREKAGPFQSLGDFARRIDARAINKRQIENLACAGAFDSLSANRRQLYEGAEVIVRHAAAATSERASAQVSLFESTATPCLADPILPAVEDWPAMERLRHEFEAIGFYLSAHPLDAYGARLARLGVVSSADLAAAVAAAPGRKRLAGIVMGKQERMSRQGNRFAFVQLSDPSGVFEVVVFAELLARRRDLLDSGEPLLITVETRGEGEELRLNAHEIETVETALADVQSDIKVFLDDPRPLQSLRSLLEREARGPGRDRVCLVLNLSAHGEVELELPTRYRLSTGFRQAIKAIPGVEVIDL
ncbi:MAG: DNA polymerase III subunit alpha, partial [Alphaproteobacteria bacterium]